MEKRAEEREEEEDTLHEEMERLEWIGEDKAVSVKEIRESAEIEYSSAKTAAILKRLREKGIVGCTMIKRTNYYYLRNE